MQFSVGCVVLNNLDGELDSIIMICQDLTETLRLSRDLVDTQRELLYMLGDALETRCQENGQCMRRVAQVAKFLALKAGLDAESADMIASATPMYDIGKVGVRDAILNKPGRLDAGEFDEMKEHARIGFNLIGNGDRPLIGLAALIAHQHHERYDGLGYPKGLRGEEICLEARIVGMAAVLDALFGERIYKPAWDESSILAYFREQRGQQFDPRLVDLLLAHWETIKML
ncbi:MAG: HD domain-containing protein, partial [Rhodoferax sp.]|nr:HD domain-containing protein [Rhodoferax sp.]